MVLIFWNSETNCMALSSVFPFPAAILRSRFRAVLSLMRSSG
eukprot:CAMPEP_0194325196 /NCGR_PEP_ID=MMETSP0171-20130528/29098_1 /TAXON_ID=218684 /ORGANISM="Corethron pennatum, Strain L29A3" /LENGTH=41 /DNA_ID= /DNA_START= /DNA_END= /DNA_ORIENTATION=